MDAKGRQPGFLADADPERVETVRREGIGEYPHRALGSGQRREKLRRFRSEPDRARSGLGVLNASARAVIAELPNLVPLEVEDFGEPRVGQRQQPDGRDRPALFLPS